jgi:integrating conjugative element protein (TIGR03757 family)
LKPFTAIRPALIALLMLSAVSFSHAQITAVTRSITSAGKATTQTGPASPGVSSDKALQIEVFTNSSIYLTHTEGAMIYQLDGLNQLEEELSQGLPANENAAMPMVRERLRKRGAAELQRRTAAVAAGIVRAGQYGIDRVPAIVFNGQAIVYGMTNVAQARLAYEQAQHRSPAAK